MTEWYYARGGQQYGPVSLDQLVEISRSGGLDPVKDLVWTPTMKDWTPAGQVGELVQAGATHSLRAAAHDGTNFHTSADATSPDALPEIPHGSVPLDIMACVKRAWALTLRHFGFVLAIGITYLGISVVASMIMGAVDETFNLVPPPPEISSATGIWTTFAESDDASPLNSLVTQVLSIFLSLGATRIGLNLVSGKQISISMLFGGGKHLLRAVGASLLYALMVCVGLVLLVVPGIYLALRFGYFQAAIVDRNLGIIDAFKYSSSLTTNNRMNLLGLALVSLLIAMVGCLALFFGLLIAFPVISLAWTAAYRCMQFGPRALLDQPGTTQPMLANQAL